MYFALYPFLLGLLSFVTIYCFFKERQALKKEDFFKNKLNCRSSRDGRMEKKMEKFHENMKKYKGKKPPPFSTSSRNDTYSILEKWIFNSLWSIRYNYRFFVFKSFFYLFVFQTILKFK